MTILIADDEQAVRDYLTTAIDWQGGGYELYEAENGQAVIDIMESRQIDLAIIDITMPVMNGLEVMEWIDSRKYPCVVSFLTCHDEFEFAKKAVRTGCYDYMLKNEITGETFLQLVTGMSQAASEEAKKKQQYAILETAAVRNRQQDICSRIHYWLNHDEDSSEDMDTFLEEELGFCRDGQSIVLLMIQIDNYQSVVQRYTNNDNVRFFALFDLTLKELFGEKPFFVLPNETGDFTILMDFEKKTPLHSVIREVCKVAETLNNSPLGIQSRVRYSLPFTNIRDCHGIYRKMKELESLAFYPLQELTLCISDYITDREECRQFLEEFGNQFREDLRSRDMAQIEICYDTAVMQIAQSLYNIRPAEFIHRCESSIHEFLIQCSLAGEVPVPELYREFSSSREYKQHIMDHIQVYCVPDDTQDKNSLIKKAVLLIQQNYSEDIGLEWLAGKLWVNSSYLSRLFSQEIGQSLTAYVNQYRIEQAKRMISGSNMKLYDVAEKTGFSSSIVFSSVFKKITGETPTEYRKRML